jgi:predicted Fe-Mo cluster-binding NifX family protein
VRRTLDELPESLDETYERILKEIKKPNRDHARRLLQCLVVAIRPLRVEELAEVLAVDFDCADGIPKLNPNWRWEDEEQAVLASCSSLIAIVESGKLRVVQFSHFSVREFLISTRLATSRRDLFRYHIALKPAHTILAQACMSILLLSDDRDEQSGDGVGNNSPLARYAAEHWAAHAQFEHVSSYLRTSMGILFDVDKPYFAAWLKLYDIDPEPPSGSTFFLFTPWIKGDAFPLYYAALCGFQDLVENLIVKYPQDVNASGGWYSTPLVAALAGKHFQTAELLRLNGADPNAQCDNGNTPLHSAASYGDVEMVQVLLNMEADVNIRNNDGRSPLNYISARFITIPNFPQSLPNVARLLLDCGADINARNNKGRSPLHGTTLVRHIEVIRVLLERGADVGAEDKEGITPFSMAKKYGYDEIMKLLTEYGVAAWMAVTPPCDPLVERNVEYIAPL